MNHIQSYEELNLRNGATEREIKAAFRQLAKEHHPDSGPKGGNTAKFQKAYQAYRHLLAQARTHNNNSTYQHPSGTPFQFISSRQIGLDTIYDLAVVKKDGQFSLVIPWTAANACPACLGQGRTLKQLGEGSVYRPTTCPRCGGSGRVDRDSHLEVLVTQEMIQAGKIRLKGAGAYEPKEARRGDLYINLNFVDRLTKSH
jgi:DnaJ-class molecular chaperone